jgi:hypothetical protein
MTDGPKKRRRRFKQTMSLAERLRAAADGAREHAENAAEGIQREVLLKKAMAAENVAQLESFLTGGPQRSPATVRASSPKK